MLLVLPAFCLHQTNVMHRQASGKKLENYTKKRGKLPNKSFGIAHFALNLLYACFVFFRLENLINLDVSVLNRYV